MTHTRSLELPAHQHFPVFHKSLGKKKKKHKLITIATRYISSSNIYPTLRGRGGSCWRGRGLVRGGGVVRWVGGRGVGVCVCVTKVLKSNSHYGKVGAVQAGGHRAAAASSLGAREAHQQKSRSSESGPAHSLQALCHWLMEMREFVFLCTSLFNTNEYGKKKKMTLFQHILTHITYRGTGHALKDGGKD